MQFEKSLYFCTIIKNVKNKIMSEFKIYPEIRTVAIPKQDAKLLYIVLAFTSRECIAPSSVIQTTIKGRQFALIVLTGYTDETFTKLTDIMKDVSCGTLAIREFYGS